MVSKLLLSLVLIIAGCLHLLKPELFNNAIPFEAKSEINIISGLLEIILGLGLWNKKTLDLSARLIALWFLALIPVHVYVSFYQIEIFGVSHPFWLWLRTLIQPGLYFWALTLQRSGWLMSQRWSEVVFIHYSVDPKDLQTRVPFPLDLYQGKAVVSLVPFVMSRIRFPFLPPVPGLSTLLELNLRTYVIIDGKPAIYFFTLDSNHLPAVMIARQFFSLPYRWVNIRFNHAKQYLFESPSFKLKAQIGPKKKPSEFDLWATERYALFTQRRNQTLEGIVEHPPWNLAELEILELEERLSRLLGDGVPLGDCLGSAYCSQLDVKFRPFRWLT